MSKLQEMKRNNKIGLLRFYDHEAAVLTVKKYLKLSMHFEFFVALEWVRNLHQRPLRLSLIRLEKPQPLLFYRSAKVQFNSKINILT